MSKTGFKKGISIVMAIIVCACMQVNVFALSDGVYTADTLTYYLNPDTGKTDDGGTGNAEIGEGMCRSAVYEKALIEQQDGKIWISLRMLLYNHISNIRIYTQNSPKGDYTEVKYSVMAENAANGSGDMRFQAPSADCYVKTQMYVAPMGRDVCFFWKVDSSTAQSGNADFVQTIKTDNSKKKDMGFTDVSSHWAKTDIEGVVAKKLFSGTSDTTFSPDIAMTRGMFVTVLGRLSGDDVSGYSSSKFKDVGASQYYAKYIGWANAKGIVSGVSETAFYPDASVTCEQAAAIMVKYMAMKGYAFKTDGTTPKLETVSTWARGSVEKAGKAGLITSQNTNGYQFKSSATRADVASIIMNLVNGYGN
ncbi:heme-binding Shp domain-containing protein [Anaerotignum sp.]|uniref:heme-binding Shp domain-containing protein n=1 Tax=Anaerotignum sp. TaxID=2039241 RepID=UPI002714E828|nr:heme-binding Shp domain-containing protein [Anaerotignum sp.]